MIQLHPNPETKFSCPYCHVNMAVTGWTIPGMRVLAVVECSNCHRVYYADLPIGQALYSPMLIEKETGQVIDPNHIKWFSNWLEKGYRNRSNLEIGFTLHQGRPARPQSKLVLLNCLDVLYGHCVLKLLNAQYYLDHCPDMDLIVMVPSFLKWMVPLGVTAIWEVEWPLRTGYQWNDWLAQKIKDLVVGYQEVFASVAYSHPHPQDYDISRFVGIQPFAISDWDKGINNPRVTYIWREDRVWSLPMKRFSFPRCNPLRRQTELISELAEQLKVEIPGLEFVVAGLGRKEKLPEWVIDLRTDQISEAQERKWCKLYAESHIVIGVHGSNMLIPSSLAGSVIDLMPDDRWGNILQDILFRYIDLREASFCYRFIPVETKPNVLVTIIKSMLLYSDSMSLTMSRESTRHKR